MNRFCELALTPELLQAVEALGYAQMTGIQAQAVPVMLAGHDVLAQARTGSGKTAAFALALLARLRIEHARLQSLVLCPTRELADQVSKEIRALARFIPNVKVLSLCGGVPVRVQLPSLAHQPHVVVGTPGRVQDLIDKGALKLDGLQSVIVDEADRMLDMGFLDAIRRILESTPATRATWMFSATYPREVREISSRFQKDPVAVTVAQPHDETLVRQEFYKAEPAEKPAAVIALLMARQPQSCLIFCNTRIDTRNLVDTLCKRGIPAIALHGDLEQRDREEALLQFANGSCRILVATDVAARGLDIKALPMVIAYELSNDADVHVHRSGRTGRAGECGLACSLVSGREMARIAAIERALGGPIEWKRLARDGDVAPLPPATMKTLLIEGGRKDKLRPGDILGALTGADGVRGAQIGKIDVFASRSYVAIERDSLGEAVKTLRGGKIKGRGFRVRKL
jgi:ATP-independent RNA helicase DbpA